MERLGHDRKRITIAPFIEQTLRVVGWEAWHNPVDKRVEESATLADPSD